MIKRFEPVIGSDDRFFNGDGLFAFILRGRFLFGLWSEQWLVKYQRRNDKHAGRCQWRNQAVDKYPRGDTGTHSYEVGADRDIFP